MRTALAADESDPRRFATDGIIPAGPSITLGPCDGYVIPREDMSTVAGLGGNISVTFRTIRCPWGQQGALTLDYEAL